MYNQHPTSAPNYPPPLPYGQSGPYPPFVPSSPDPQSNPSQPYPSQVYPQSNPSDQYSSLAQGIATISMDGPDMGYVMVDERRSSGYNQIQPLSPPPDSSQAFTPQADPELNPGIAITLPTAATLSSAMSSIDYFTDKDKLHWAQDVIRLLDRTLHIYKADPALPVLPPVQQVMDLYPLVTAAVMIIISLLECPVPTLSAAAYYLRAHLLDTGNVPEELQLGMSKNARQAFKDFEKAARGGEARAWFRLGKDYENCGELDRARNCYEKGLDKGDGECLYRLGIAHLAGQLNFPLRTTIGMDYLRRAADTATIDCPQSPFFFGTLLAGENTSIPFPLDLLLPANSPPSERLAAQHGEAKSYILKAAYLCFPPAQHKAGVMHEFAQLTCPYDPLLSVQYYALASQEGEVEADMALSKWFLVGAEGCFEKEETLSRTFAQKAANMKLPNGLFALGYYNEVGIGGPIDIDQAKRWYHKAAKRGNQEAAARLRALEMPVPSALSENDHLTALNSTLIRKHTTAKERSDRSQDGHHARRYNDQEALRRQMQEEASKASGVGISDDRRGGGMPVAQRTGYQSADPRLVASPPPMPPMPPSADWRNPYPPRNATYPMLPQSPQTAPPVPLGQSNRPFDYQHQQPQSQPGHGRTVSSSSMPAMHRPGQHVQPQYPRPPSSQASSGTGSSYGNGSGASRPLNMPTLSTHQERPASVSHQDTRPLNPAHPRIPLSQDERSQHRKSYALQDPGTMPRPASSQPGDMVPTQAGARKDSDLMPPGRVQGNGHKGADTFEQMGFVSKPVSGDNDCRIM